MESLDDDKMRGRFSDRFKSEESAAPSWDSFKSNLAPRRRRPAGYWFTGGLLLLLAGLATYFKLIAPVAPSEVAFNDPSSIQKTKEDSKPIAPELAQGSSAQKTEANQSGKDKKVIAPQSLSKAETRITKPKEKAEAAANENSVVSNQPKAISDEKQIASDIERTNKATSASAKSKNQTKAKLKTQKSEPIENAIAGVREIQPVKEMTAENSTVKNQKGKSKKSDGLSTVEIAGLNTKANAYKRKPKGENLAEVAGPRIVKSSISKNKKAKAETNPMFKGGSSKGEGSSEIAKADSEIKPEAQPLQEQVVLNETIAKPADTLLAVKKSPVDSAVNKAKDPAPNTQVSKRSRFSLWAQATYSGQNIRIANSYSDRLVQISHNDRLTATRITGAMGGGYKIISGERWSLSALMGIRFWQTEFTSIRETRSSYLAVPTGNDSVVTYGPAITHSLPQKTIHRSVGLLTGIVIERRISGPWSLLAETNLLNHFTIQTSGPANVQNYTSAGIRPALQYNSGQWDWSVGLEWFMPLKGPATGQAIIGNNGVGIRAVRYFRKKGEK